MVATQSLEGKVQQSFLENVLDASGAAIGTSMALKVLISGANLYGAGIAYLLPYSAFRLSKYFSQFTVQPSFNVKEIGKALYDLIRNVIPSDKNTVPATVDLFSSGSNYLVGEQLLKYVT